eukprot:1140070-Pelagomonas_calceolata.AAC.5
MHVQGFGDCAANLSSLPMSVLNKPAPQGLILRALIVILPATLWRPVFMLEMIWFWQPESMWSALSN